MSSNGKCADDDVNLEQEAGLRPFASGFRVSHALLSVLPFFCFFLFDNYVSEYRIRLLDFVGLTILIVLSVVRLHGNRLSFSLSKRNAAFIAVCLIYVFVSFIFHPDQYRPDAGILIGIFVYSYYSSLNHVDDVYRKWLTGILLISVSAFFFQGIYYFLSGEVLKMVLVAPGDVRVWYGGEILRLTGFYMEPNSYCIATAMLVLLRREVMHQSLDLLAYIGIATLIISMSLWGAMIGVFILAYDYLSRKRNGVQIFFVLIIVLPLMMGSMFALASHLGKHDPLRVTLFDRAEKIMDVVTGTTSHVEGSFRDRYLAISKVDKRNVSDWQMFFGHGISITDFQNYGGANGLSFLLYSFGLAGILVIALALIILALRRGLSLSLWILISLSSYPLLTYFYWWAWLALLLSFSSRQVTGGQPLVVKQVATDDGALALR